MAVAAVAAAGLLWKRRQDAMLDYFPEVVDDHRLEELRVAGL